MKKTCVEWKSKVRMEIEEIKFCYMVLVYEILGYRSVEDMAGGNKP